MLTQEELEEIKAELDSCHNPMFLFHDDPDGLCSFLLLYRYKKEGHGVIVKKTPRINDFFIKKVEEYEPDKIFILDIAIVEQEFVDKAKTPIVWIDHHEPIKLSNVKYYNPRIKGNDKDPVSSVCYNAVKQDLWIAAAGCVADYFIPDFLSQFAKEHPKLLKPGTKDPGEALFDSELGKLCRILSFTLMGTMNDVMASIKILTRIKTPEEILQQETSAGKFIYKKYEKTETKYLELLNSVEKAKKGKLLMHIYTDADVSMTKDLANELLYRNPDKIIITGRDKNDEIKMSIRAKKRIDQALAKALVGIDGYGGGHENACGAVVKKDDFERFIKNFKEEMKI